MENISCKEIINNLLDNGGLIIVDKEEGSKDLKGRTVVIIKNNCQIKISYLDLCGKEIVIEHVCCCINSKDWKVFPDKCKLAEV